MNFRLLYYPLIFGLFTNCYSVNNIESLTEPWPEEFNSENWVKDNEGCMGYRLSVVPLLEKEDWLIGRDKQEVIIRFGAPNYESTNIFTYFITSDKCKGSYFPNGINYMIIFEQNTVSDAVFEIID